MSGWKIQAVPLLIVPALLAGCQTPASGRIALDVPVLRTARLGTSAPWMGWWRGSDETDGDELTGRAQLASLPDLHGDESWGPTPAEPHVAEGEPRRLPQPDRDPIPIEQAGQPLSGAAWPPGEATEFLPRPGGSDWTRRP